MRTQLVDGLLADLLQDVRFLRVYVPGFAQLAISEHRKYNFDIKIITGKLREAFLF
jgi:hypothetical protein